jgi:hypothetical protein
MLGRGGSAYIYHTHILQELVHRAQRNFFSPGVVYFGNRRVSHNRKMKLKKGYTVPVVM